jgi:hypothetical protein
VVLARGAQIPHPGVTDTHVATPPSASIRFTVDANAKRYGTYSHTSAIIENPEDGACRDADIRGW